MAHHFINIHSHFAATASNTTLVSQYVSTTLELVPPADAATFLSIGLHPWYTTEQTFEKQWEVLRDHIAGKNYFALGECGLDRRRGPSFSFQEEILLRHCELAKTLDKPVILHVVKAISDLLAFQKKHRFDIPLIVHGFRGNSYEAAQLTANGFHLSFGHALLLNIRKIEDAFIQTPIDRIFLETDMSNEPIGRIYQKAADLKKISLETFSQQIIKNLEAIQ